MKYRYLKRNWLDEIHIMYLYMTDSYFIEDNSFVYTSSASDLMTRTNSTDLGYEI